MKSTKFVFVMAAAIFAAVLPLSGCSPGGAVEPTETLVMDGATRVRVVVLSDGTRCVVATNAHGVAIDCLPREPR